MAFLMSVRTTWRNSIKLFLVSHITNKHSRIAAVTVEAPGVSKDYLSNSNKIRKEKYKLKQEECGAF